MQERRYSVDIIALYVPRQRNHKGYGKYVVIKRLSFPLGLAFPGGGIEKDEEREEAAFREYKEETNLTFVHCSGERFQMWLPKTYDEEGRDPRGPATSYVAYGFAEGRPKNEPGKTEVLFLSEEEIIKHKNEFVFDHFQMFLDYLSLSFKNKK